MYNKCPKCGCQLTEEALAAAGVCPGCGLVFAKWISRTLRPGTVARPRAAAHAENAGWLKRSVAELLYVEPRTDVIAFWGRVALYAAFFVWGWYFILLDFRSNEIGSSFMHRVNLVFHEAGHIVFMPFGSFMMTLGGSLGQLLMPVIVGAALVIKNRDNFGGSIGLWWLAQSLMDLAPYIGDARALKLMLLGGGTGQDRPGVHDWENILLDLNLIKHDTRIAAAADALGTILMLVAFTWGAYILLLQYRKLKSQD